MSAGPDARDAAGAEGAPAGSETADDEAFADLELPDLTLRGLMSPFGPGVILMMTGIGTSHLVTAPTAGGRFAHALLWCIPVAYVFTGNGSRTVQRQAQLTREGQGR